MIVAMEDFAGLPRPIAMVDGGFDPLHAGHVKYFEAAAALAPLCCCLSPDSYISRKHRVLLPQSTRAEVINALRPISYVHCSESDTHSVLRALRPTYYVKGNDWAGRLPAAEVETCRELG